MVYKAVSSDQELLGMYVALVETVVVPHLKKLLVRAETEKEEKKTTSTSDETATPSAKKKHTFYYQYPPTLRLQPGPNKQHGQLFRKILWTDENHFDVFTNFSLHARRL